MRKDRPEIAQVKEEECEDNEYIRWKKVVQEDVDDSWKEVAHRMKNEVQNKWVNRRKGEESFRVHMRSAQLD